MLRLARLVLVAALIWPLSAMAEDIIVEKKAFSMPSYTTVAGETIKNVKIGWNPPARSMPTSRTPSWSRISSPAPATPSANIRRTTRWRAIGIT